MRFLMALLLFVPISIVLHFMGAPDVVMFVAAGLAIVPLAGFIGIATDELAKYVGPSIGGLLNATFGNATELIIALIAIHSGKTEVVKASIVGSIIGNLLLVLGLSILLGGLKHKMQKFNRDMAGMYAATLTLATIAFLVPALFVANVPGLGPKSVSDPIKHLSLGVAGILMLLYVGSLLFSMKTHEHLVVCEEEDSEPPVWSKAKAIGVLFASAVAVSLESEFLVGAIDAVVQKIGLSEIFIGIIVIPIIGNAAEHSAAVMLALKNKMDLSFSIAVSSSTQVAMFVAPLAVFAGALMGHPVTMVYSNFELISIAVSVFIVVLIALDGKCHWLEGAQLIAVYVIIALAFFFLVKDDRQKGDNQKPLTPLPQTTAAPGTGARP